jgi:hypothetical protein
MLALLNAALGQTCSLRLDKAIDGNEPRQTNEFLQLVAFAATAASVAASVRALVPRALADADSLVAASLAAEAAEVGEAALLAEAARDKARATAAAPDAGARNPPQPAGRAGRGAGVGAGGAPVARTPRSGGAPGSGASAQPPTASGRADARARPSAAPGLQRVASASSAAKATSSSGASAARPPRPQSRHDAPQPPLARGPRLSASDAESEASSEWTEVEINLGSGRDAYGRGTDLPSPLPARQGGAGGGAEPRRPFRAHSMPAQQAAEAEAGTWACARCLSRNDDGLTYCETCATIRKAASTLGGERGAGARGGVPSPVYRSERDSWWSAQAPKPSGRERGGSPARAGGACSSASVAGSARELAAADAPPPASRLRPSAGGGGGGGGPTVEEELRDEEEGGAARQAGWYERKLHRQWSAHQKSEKVREDAEEIRRLREDAAKAQRARNAHAARDTASAERRQDAQRHEQLWEAFSRALPSRIRYVDIPWLPIDSEDLLCEALGLVGAARDGGDARKKAHRAASMRWHPDKFSQQLGSRIDEGDHERIMQRVTATSQAINTMVR